MARTIHRLTHKEIMALGPGKHPDGGNLFLQITVSLRGSVSRSGLFAYELRGERHAMGLGAYPADRNLTELREEAKRCRQLLVDGIDPLQERRKRAEEQAVEAAKNKSFGDVAAAYIKAHQNDWRSPKHATQWKASLEKDAKPIAHVAVSLINTAHALQVLEPIWQKKPETASRTRARCERVIAAATAAGFRKREDGNPFAWTGHLEELLGSKSKAQEKKRKSAGRQRHHKALPIDEVPQLIFDLQTNGSLSAQALEFTILAVARTGETTGATEDEFDLTAKTWTIPAERMKAERDHRVPLSDRAVEIVRERLKQSHCPFPISDAAMAELIKDLPLTRGRATVHGMRACFKTWASERTSFDRMVVEAALAHKLGDNATEEAYMRGDLFEKRRRLMKQWESFVSKGNTRSTETKNNVRSIRAAPLKT